MENIILVSTIPIILLLIVQVVQNCIGNRKLRKLNKGIEERVISDERYFELKYRLQTYITVGGVAIAIFAFFGINSINDVLEEPKDVIDNYYSKVSEYDSLILDYKDSINIYRDNILYLAGEAEIVQDSMAILKLGLEGLQREYRLNAKSYFVQSFPIDTIVKGEPIKVTFKELQKYNSNIPSSFGHSPFVTIVPKGSGMYNMKEISVDFFSYNIMYLLALDLDASLVEDKLIRQKPIKRDDARYIDIFIVEIL
jgi:hypothetical protein